MAIRMLNHLCVDRKRHGKEVHQMLWLLEAKAVQAVYQRQDKTAGDNVKTGQQGNTDVNEVCIGSLKPALCSSHLECDAVRCDGLL